MKVFMTIIFLLFFHGPLWAGENSQDELLPLQVCINRTLKNHPDVKKLLYEVEQEKASLMASKGVNFPQVKAQVEYNPYKTFVMPKNGAFDTADEEAWQAGLILTQKLYDFGSSRGKVAASQIGENIARLSLKEAKLLLTYQVQTLYDSLLLHRAAIKTREEDLKTRQAFYSQAGELRVNGLKTRADESRFLASVYSAEEALLEAKAAFLKAKKLMELYMGESINVDSGFQNLLEERSLITLDEEKKAALRNRLLSQNNKMELQEQAIYKSEAILASARGDRFGSLQASASYFRESNLSDYDLSKAGISLQVPLFNGGVLKAEEDKAKANVKQAREAFALQKLELVKSYDEAIIDLDLADARMKTRKAKIKAAGEASDLIAARYREGMATSVEVLDAEAQRLDAKLGLLEARYQKSNTLYFIAYLTSNEERFL